MARRATTISGKRRMALPPNRSAYTLLEVLLALGLAAVLIGISIPYVADSFRKTPGEEASDEMAKTVLMVRNSAVEKGEARQIALFENGIEPQIDSVKAVRLPAGWKLELRRMTESRFHKPSKREVWTFNSAGICEPLTLRIHGGKESVEMTFDALTGQVLNE